MTVFETTAHVALRVSLSAGEVTVETTAEPGVEIDLVPLRDNDVTREAIAAAKVELTDRGGRHEIVVQIPKKSGITMGRSPKVGVRVRCPVGSDLQLRASSADLEARGSLGDVDVKTASGDVTIEDLSRLRADTASGDLRVRDVAGAAEFRTASGDATVRRCGGLLSASLVSGDLSVGEAAAGLTVTTVSGDVRVDVAGGGKMQIQAVSGDVYLGVRPGERLYIDASSVSGRMVSELDLADTPATDSNAPVVELRVRTVSGDASIVRAAHVGA